MIYPKHASQENSGCLNTQTFFPDKLVQSGVEFLAALIAHGGANTTMEIWAKIESAIGADLTAAIFMAAIAGPPSRQVVVAIVDPNQIRSGGNADKIDAIKLIREATNMMLKEAKNFVDEVYICGTQPLTVSDHLNVDVFSRAMARLGFKVSRG